MKHIMSVKIDSKTIPLLQNVVLNVLRLVEQSFKEKRKLTDADLSNLYTVFGSTLERALELLDNASVTIYETGEGRSVVQVTGSTGLPYTLFPRVNFCSCPAYNYHVIRTATSVTCKHVLAMWLAEIMGIARKVHATNELLAQILCARAMLQVDSKVV